MSQRKLFVYGIDTRSRLCELVDLFEQYGRILRVECPPPRDRYATVMFAFIEYCSSRDAEMAVRSLDGVPFYCNPLKVEYARGESAGIGAGGKHYAQTAQQPSIKYRRSPSPPPVSGRSPMRTKSDQPASTAAKFREEGSYSPQYPPYAASSALDKQRWQSNNESFPNGNDPSSVGRRNSSEPIAHID